MQADESKDIPKDLKTSEKENGEENKAYSRKLAKLEDFPGEDNLELSFFASRKSNNEKSTLINSFYHKNFIGYDESYDNNNHTVLKNAQGAEQSLFLNKSILKKSEVRFSNKVDDINTILKSKQDRKLINLSPVSLPEDKFKVLKKAKDHKKTPYSKLRDSDSEDESEKKFKSSICAADSFPHKDCGYALRDQIGDNSNNNNDFLVKKNLSKKIEMLCANNEIIIARKYTENLNVESSLNNHFIKKLDFIENSIHEKDFSENNQNSLNKENSILLRNPFPDTQQTKDKMIKAELDSGSWSLASSKYKEKNLIEFNNTKIKNNITISNDPIKKFTPKSILKNSIKLNNDSNIDISKSFHQNLFENADSSLNPPGGPITKNEI